ncbi:ferric reductase-like transmembrane domain-containing protein [Acetobacter conturbans]|uniref:Ferric oxidoreductase domain-containing protein n=1 Tax=Acetobacter conturbans TaxID=1737472 RepID=A0ABX0JZ74_9PROT|nr:ferric reductase-like transmembrane domain-containing protein [Acetobacter conturbans]NHN87730.1 hypothetical protein [Acetobacter conturbans]
MQSWMTLSLSLTLLYLLFFGLFGFGTGQPALTRGWDFAMLSGLSAIFAFLALFILTGRPFRKPAYEGKFFMRLHIFLGYLASLFVAVHVGGSLLCEPLIWQDIWPPVLPLMQTGLLSSILLIVMLTTSHTGTRRLIFGNSRFFRYAHYGLAGVLLCAASFHAWQAGFRISGHTIPYILALVTLATLASPAVNRCFLPERAPRTQKRRIRNTTRLAVPAVTVLCLAGILTPILCVLWLHH